MTVYTESEYLAQHAQLSLHSDTVPVCRDDLTLGLVQELHYPTLANQDGQDLPGIRALKQR